MKFLLIFVAHFDLAYTVIKQDILKIPFCIGL